MFVCFSSATRVLRPSPRSVVMLPKGFNLAGALHRALSDTAMPRFRRTSDEPTIAWNQPCELDTTCQPSRFSMQGFVPFCIIVHRISHRIPSHAGPWLATALSLLEFNNNRNRNNNNSYPTTVHNMPLPVCSLRSSHTVLPEQLHTVLSLSQTPALRAITPTRVSGSSG